MVHLPFFGIALPPPTCQATWPNQTTIIGRIANGQAQGFCEVTDISGGILTCCFENGRATGPGLGVRPDGTEQRCRWVNGRMEGAGVLSPGSLARVGSLCDCLFLSWCPGMMQSCVAAA